MSLGYMNFDITTLMLLTRVLRVKITNVSSIDNGVYFQIKIMP